MAIMDMNAVHRAHYALGQVYSLTGKWQEAVDEFKCSAELNKGNPTAEVGFGAV